RVARTGERGSPASNGLPTSAAPSPYLARRPRPPSAPDTPYFLVCTLLFCWLLSSPQYRAYRPSVSGFQLAEDIHAARNNRIQWEARPGHGWNQGDRRSDCESACTRRRG